MQRSISVYFRAKVSQILNSEKVPSLRFWLLAGFLSLVFLTGGSSRIDVQSLAVLRPISVIACALGLITLKREHLTGRPWFFFGFFSILLLSILHLIPLPPALWQSLPGREILVEVEKTAGLSGIWRPLTITPMNGWHALLSLFTPLAVLLLGVQLNRDDLFRMLPVLITLASLSGLFGVLQVISDPQGPLYFYRITNNGAAVGLFANRNHAAVLLACMFPMLATFASISTGTVDQQKIRLSLAAALAIILVPLILVTGSRSGLFLSILAMGAALLLYKKPQQGRTVRKGGQRFFNIGPVPLFGGISVLCLAFLTMFFSRAKAFERLFNETSVEDGRVEYWSVALDLASTYFPFGSGIGSFVEAYQMREPDALLNASYLNHAHNDWIETAMTTGLPGLLIFISAIILYCLRNVRLWRAGAKDRRAVKMAKMASVGLALLAFASFADYPLRTPTMMCVMMLFSLWFVEWGRDQDTLNPAATGE